MLSYFGNQSARWSSIKSVFEIHKKIRLALHLFLCWTARGFFFFYARSSSLKKKKKTTKTLMSDLSHEHSSVGVDCCICLWVWRLWRSSTSTFTPKAESAGAHCSRLSPVVLECPHGWWLPSIFGQPVPVPRHTHNRKVFCMFDWNFVYFCSCTFYLGLSLDITRKRLLLP